MIPYHPNPSDRAFGQPKACMLRFVGDYGYLAGHRLASQDHHRAAVAYAEQKRRLAEAGVHPPGVRAFIPSVREATGAALIRVGERLRRTPVAPTAATEAPLA